MQITLEQKIIGCLLGGAIGDALGMPFVGVAQVDIGRLGPVRDFQPARDVTALTLPLSALGESEISDPLDAGQWTDDTQLALALTETLIEQGGLLIPEAWAHKLVRWLNEAPRAPGLSTLHAAFQLRTGGALWDEAADPDGAGCGAATRAAPIGVLYAEAPGTRRTAATEQAEVTHGHPDAQAAALAVAEATALVMAMSPAAMDHWDGIRFLTEIRRTVQDASEHFTEFAHCIGLAISLLEGDIETETAARVLGVSAWCREAVPCALYLVARMPQDLEALLCGAVNLTGGATESIACMVGAIGGALHGVSALPARWRAGVEDAPRIIETALSLAALKNRSKKLQAFSAPTLISTRDDARE